MSDIRDIAKQVKAAKQFGQGNYLRCGRGVLIVDSITYNPEAFKGAVVVAEFRIESSASDPTARDEKGQPILANAPNTSVSKVWPLTGENKAMMLGKLQGFLQTLDGDPMTDVGDLLVSVTDSTQPARGLRIGYEAYQTETKKNKKVITVENWESVENTAETKAAALATLAKLS